MNVKDNRGFSLVELVIVIGIIAILAGSVSIGISVTSGKPATKCANELASVLQHIRVLTMGKSKIEIEISKDSDDRLFVKQKMFDSNGSASGDTSTIVGDKGVTVEISKTGRADDWKEITASTPVTIEFSRSSGSLKPTEENGSEYYQYFRITKVKTIKYVYIVPLTGKIKVTDTL